MANTRTTEAGSKAEQESQRVEAAVARPFLLGAARTWKQRVAQLDFALEVELEIGRVAA